MTIPVMPGLLRYRDGVNADPELAVIGDWFTTIFTLTFGNYRYALKIDRGKIVDIIAAPRLWWKTFISCPFRKSNSDILADAARPARG
jgi:hypothetical protein